MTILIGINRRYVYLLLCVCVCQCTLCWSLLIYPKAVAADCELIDFSQGGSHCSSSYSRYIIMKLVPSFRFIEIWPAYLSRWVLTLSTLVYLGCYLDLN